MAKRKKQLTPELVALRKKVSAEVAKANRRVRALRKAGYNKSPALKNLMKSGPGINTVRGKNTEHALGKLYGRVKGFNIAATSTVRGTDAVLRNFHKRHNAPELVDRKKSRRARLKEYTELTEFMAKVLEGGQNNLITLYDSEQEAATAIAVYRDNKSKKASERKTARELLEQENERQIEKRRDLRRHLDRLHKGDKP